MRVFILILIYSFGVTFPASAQRDSAVFRFSFGIGGAATAVHYEFSDWDASGLSDSLIAVSARPGGGIYLQAGARIPIRSCSFRPYLAVHLPEFSLEYDYNTYSRTVQFENAQVSTGALVSYRPFTSKISPEFSLGGYFAAFMNRRTGRSLGGSSGWKTYDAGLEIRLGIPIEGARARILPELSFRQGLINQVNSSTHALSSPFQSLRFRTLSFILNFE